MSYNYAAIRSADEFEQLVNRLIEWDRPFGFDIESGFKGEKTKASTKPALLHQHPEWVFVGFSVAGLSNPDAEEITDRVQWARYIPIAHQDNGNVDDVKRVARAFWRLLQTGKGVAHNLQFEQHSVARFFREQLSNDALFGNAVAEADGYYPALSDSMVEVAVCGLHAPGGISPAISGGPAGYGLKPQVKRNFGHTMITFEELWEGESKKVKRSFDNRDSTSPKVITYACEDALWCLALHLKHYPLVKDMLVYDVEMDLIPVLCRMERTALLLRWDLLEYTAQEAKVFGEKFNEEIQQELSERLGRTVAVNLNSAPQLAKILFEELGVPIIERSKKTGNPSTGAKALAPVAKKDVTVKHLLQYREVQKLRNSYLDRYILGLNYLGNGRAVANHNQLGTITGRLSVDGVSYQQWPKPYDYKLGDGSTFEFNFRDALIAPEGFRIVGYDFSQVELRMIAGIAQEQALIESFLADEDIHVRTAALMLKKPIESITKKERAIGKTLNFAIVYGAGASRIANMLTSPQDPITTKMAQAMLNAYLGAFPSLRRWIEETRGNAFRDTNIGGNVVYTPFGRPVRIWEYLSDKKGIIAQGDRLATNAPPQGGAADYMKIGMIRAQKAIDEAGLQDKVKMVMTIHDALEFYVHDSIPTQDFINLIQPAVVFGEELFPDILSGYPPIKADWHEGHSWGDVFEIKLDGEDQIVGYTKEGWKTMVSSFEEALEHFEAPVVVEPVKHTSEGYIIDISECETATQREVLALLRETLIRDPEGVELSISVGGTDRKYNHRFLKHTLGTAIKQAKELGPVRAKKAV